jgi:hypothetical protein
MFVAPFILLVLSALVAGFVAGVFWSNKRLAKRSVPSLQQRRQAAQRTENSSAPPEVAA